MISEPLLSNLRLIVSAYRAATGASMARVSKAFYGSGGGLDQVFDGSCVVTVKKVDSMVSAIRAAWPEGAPWPDLDPIVIPPPGEECPRNPQGKKRRRLSGRR